MRNTLIFCLAVLILGAQCASISDKYPSLKKSRSMLTLLTQIESKIKAKAPINDIDNLIFGFLDEIILEQANQDALHEIQTKECKEEIESRNSEIDAAKSAIEKATSTLDSCNAQNNRAEADHASVSNQLVQTENYLQQLIDTRSHEAAQFVADTEAYNSNSAGADEAIEILKQIWFGEAEFIQLAKHANKMLKNAVSIRKVHKLAPVMASLAQLASKQIIADEGLLNQVLNILNQFRQDIETEYRSLEAAEQEAIEVYTANRAKTEDFIAQLKQSKADLEVELQKLAICINNQTAILTTAEAKLTRNSNLLEAAVNMCNSFEKEYQAATEGRNQEKELIDLILQKFKARGKQISRKVIDRGYQDNFDAHVNQSEYQDAENYEHERISYNSKGAEGAQYDRDESLENL